MPNFYERDIASQCELAGIYMSPMMSRYYYNQVDHNTVFQWRILLNGVTREFIEPYQLYVM